MSAPGVVRLALCRASNFAQLAEGRRDLLAPDDAREALRKGVLRVLVDALGEEKARAAAVAASAAAAQLKVLRKETVLWHEGTLPETPGNTTYAAYLLAEIPHAALEAALGPDALTCLPLLQAELTWLSGGEPMYLAPWKASP